MTESSEGTTNIVRNLIIVVITALSTVALCDLGLARLSPPKHIREVVHAMAEYEHEDPTILVLGSSHARTFAVMDGVIRERTRGEQRIMAVPLEWGKFRSYEWLLRNRLEPVIDESAGGTKRRPSLSRFVLVAAWWDLCWYEGDPPVFNLPSRAWSFEHFVHDVAEHGITSYNRNYVTSRWLGLFENSILATDRGHGHALTALRERVRPLSEEAKQRQFEKKLANWRGIMDRGTACIGHPEELAAAERILAWGQARGLDTSLVLYPMMPMTVGDMAREKVQEPFRVAMRELAERRGVRFFDFTFDPRLGDGDFQPDFDHLKPEAHLRYSNELLDEELAFLLRTPSAAEASR